MKQNSRILFHHMRKSLTKSYFRHLVLFALFVGAVAFNPISGMAATADKPEYLASFDPAKGFKPAQSDLAEIFLQIAGSLEFYGSPLPYLQHMKAEHERIEAKYRQRFGGESKAYWPAYMANDYFDRFAANWNALAPKLGLETLAKNTGNYMRNAITGAGGTGTMLAEIFNHHQAAVLEALAGKSLEPADFDALKNELISRLGIDKTVTNDQNDPTTQRDALALVTGIRVPINELFGKLDASLSPHDAAQIKAALTSVFMDVGRAAQAELEEAIIEHAMDDQSATPKKADDYTAENETALSAPERKTFAAFLRKKRFTRDDFAALDKFYSGAYDKLSERGKDEMSSRIYAGMRHEN